MQRSNQHPVLIYGPLFSGLISPEWLTLCSSRYCSASVHDTDLSALIYQAPSRHYSHSTHSRDTVVTEWRRAETKKMMSAIPFIRCISHPTCDFQLVCERSMSLSAAMSARRAFSHLGEDSLAWMLDVLHKGHVITDHAHTKSLFLVLPLLQRCTCFPFHIMTRKWQQTTSLCKTESGDGLKCSGK